MKVTLEEIIQSIYPLPQQVLEDVLEHFQHLEYPKNYFLLKPGKPCKYLWFMIEGAVRYFYTNEQGKEINTWFSLDTQIITDTTSFVHQEPAQESIQLIENCELCAIEYSALQTLLQKHHSFALWYIKLVEMHYISQIEDRLADLQFLDAKQRYQKLLNHYPDITNRISLGNIASYLNITQETLSRIRAGKI
ncbi:MAG: Crp/Fnr family transcriptional regulator [Flavobacteriales bacterium]|nr:Crp/Fnr family transcriptional regulator [Flavobacteriales bacterium]NCA20725.1 Crp/Fnr family transcriptional regulator [Crocinitomicaceae bacterium]